jgi:hypothetical protein
LQAFPPHQLGTESNWAQAFELNYYVFLRKKDGSVWMRWFGDDRGKEAEKIEIEPGILFGRVTSLENGAWRSAAYVRSDFRVGVRSDGTFRIWANYKLDRQRYYEWVAADFQIGKETNWLAVAGYDEKIVTLKYDGSLWLWDFAYDWRNGWNNERRTRELVNTIPVRLGTHSDWIAVAGNGGGVISLAADGGLWYWPLERPDYYYGGNQKFEPLLDIPRKPIFLGNIFGQSD